MRNKSKGKKTGGANFFGHEAYKSNAITVYDRLLDNYEGYRELANTIVTHTFHDYQEEIRLGNKMLKDGYYDTAEKCFNNAYIVRKFILTEYFDNLCGKINCDELLQKVDYDLIDSGLTILMPRHLKGKKTELKVA